MEDSGGVSVSDLVARHGGSRSDLKPVPPPSHGGVDQPSGSHRLSQPTPPAATGGRRRAPDEPPSQPRIAAPQPPRAARAYGMQPQGTGRTRSDNDMAASQSGG